MKKNYTNSLSVALALLIASASFAQNRVAKVKNVPATQFAKTNPIKTFGTIDTLTNHWDVIAPYPSVDTARTYGATSGFLAGQNDYGDIGKAQKFDSNFGVTSGGSIQSLLFWYGGKLQGAGTAAFTATIWSDNAGSPGTVLGTAPVFTIATIDTSAAALHLIGPSTAVEGAYNVVATFSSPVSIPANQTFWAGVTFTYANGDSAGLVTSSDYLPGDGQGTTGNFPNAGTHTFEQMSDNTWQSFNDGGTTAGSTWAMDIALAIYPVVDLGVGVNETNSSIASVTNTPNPAISTTLIEFELKESADVNLSLYDITGTKVLSIAQGVQAQGKHSVKMDVSDLSAGMYFYTLTAGNHQSTHKLNVVK